MDARKLETTRKTATDPVQRCTPACPSSTSCWFRRARSKLREGGKPCTREILPHTRFVLEVERIFACAAGTAAPIYACDAGTAAAFDLPQSANDTVLFELLLERRTRFQAGSSAFAEEASKALRPGPLNGRPRQSVAKNRSRSLGPSSMRLTERKRILIDIRRALPLGATFASPPAHLSLTKKTGTDSGKALEGSGDVSVPGFGNTQGGYI